MIDELDKKVIGTIQGDLPVDARPFAAMAEKLGITEEAFLEGIHSLKERGIIRRFGATLRHQEVGFNSNAMVAWVVPEEVIERVGESIAQNREVTHCYQRRPQKDWKYNLFTMVHGNDKEDCFKIASRMSLETGIKEYTLLFSEKEFKKTSMAYF